MSTSPRRRFKPDERQPILDAHMDAHDGMFNPDVFLSEASHPDHPAHEWYDWSNAEAGHKWRLYQTRTFVQGLRITIQKPMVTHHGNAIFIIAKAPAVVSPVGTRESGGGYISVATPQGQTALLYEGLRGGFGLVAWLRRYRAVLSNDVIVIIEQAIQQLEKEIEDGS